MAVHVQQIKQCVNRVVGKPLAWALYLPVGPERARPGPGPVRPPGSYAGIPDLTAGSPKPGGEEA